MTVALRSLAAPLVALGLAACAKPPLPPHDIPSAALLQPDADTGAVRYISRTADFSRYDSVFIEPVRIYTGAAGRFGSIGLEDRREIGRYMQTEFPRILGENVRLAEAPGPTALRLRLILVGLRVTDPLLAATSHFSITGLAMNIGRSLVGMNGTFMGSVTFIAELYDGESETLVAAIQSERSAHALDVTEDVSTLGSAKVGVLKGARELRDALATFQNGHQF